LPTARSRQGFSRLRHDSKVAAWLYAARTANQVLKGHLSATRSAGKWGPGADSEQHCEVACTLEEVGASMRFLKFISAAVIGALVGILTGYASFRSYERASFFDWLKDSGTTQNVQEGLLWVFVGALVGMGLWWAWTTGRCDQS
jgi:hypothetical protein